MLLPLALIAAVSRDGVIGQNGRMPWHYSSDLRFFRRMTMGHTLIMGRKTFDSLGKPLVGRKNIVLTRHENVQFEGAEVFHSLKKAIETARKYDPCPIIIGGAEVYRLALPFVTLMYLTHIDEPFEGDTYFPTFGEEEWKIVESTAKEKLRFVIYQRKEQD